MSKSVKYGFCKRTFNTPKINKLIISEVKLFKILNLNIAVIKKAIKVI